MPSPFPGMDPYLEGDDWISFHIYLATEIARPLTPLLRPKYIALPEKRFEIAEEGSLAIESIYPDVAIASLAPPSSSPNISLAEAPFLLETIIDEESPHTWVEIRDVAHRRLVTTIEILSPEDKRGLGREAYLNKRRQLLRSFSHLVELDLLRRGARLPMKGALPPAEYYVLVSHNEMRPVVQVWPISLQNPLPPFPVPLLPGDPDAALDLQAAVDAVYNLGGFDLVLDYTQPPAPPLSDDQLTWVAECIAAAKS